FPVDVRDPLKPSVCHRLVELRNFAVATSSIEESNALLAGPHAHEVEREAFDQGASICVLAPRCVFADALTKVVALSGTATHPLLARCGASAIVLHSRRA
ncbi:MAG: FAD:protein FMN transferase, partial [Burkholderiaceae bacterium]